MRTTAWRILSRLSSLNDGQGLVEYALVLSLIAIISIVALLFLGGTVKTALSEIGNTL